MEIAANGTITRILDHEIISGRTTTKVAVDQDHLGIRCVRLHTDLGADAIGKPLSVKDLYDPKGESEAQEIIVNGDYQKVPYN